MVATVMAIKAQQHGKAPLRAAFLVAAAALVGVAPQAGLAVVGSAAASLDPDRPALEALDFFTPASVDPELASRVAQKSRERGIRFTPAGAGRLQPERTVTVAVRVDNDIAEAISLRTVKDAPVGQGSGIAGLQPSRFNLGTARGYQSFARPQTGTNAPISGGTRIKLPDNVRNLTVPDLAEFEPQRSSARDEPGRLQPRIALEDQRVTGRSPNTLDSLGSQTVDVGGSFRLSPNLDVTAGVRLSQERERLDPLTNSLQDSQAVYVGTQIRF
ncbi:MAG: hypothetical protein WA918_00135 [Erythrobacter sp.]